VINFNYFAQGGAEDVESVVAGVELVRKLTGQVKHLIEVEEHPGPQVQSRADSITSPFIIARIWHSFSPLAGVFTSEPQM
jgi:hypothetical protein